MKIWPTKIDGVHGDLPMKDGDFPWRFRNFPGHGATRHLQRTVSGLLRRLGGLPRKMAIEIVDFPIEKWWIFP